ncbi:uncharacterized protein DUF1127 [Dongia mobilis]|uniref:Uncharacterized protein DUF1127 n=1 Tax=Dongia mobilis TaxID=578943 RepID=A0A4R6WMS4_9PROT|nr:DUF1127 domain-containing protein [Dongia mobilis]TDQ82292.1 uncharacterized protein DUF1127 [Dongia mobilis]
MTELVQGKSRLAAAAAAAQPYLWRLLWRRWRQWRDARLTRRALEHLDARMLKDIGIERWEIDSRARQLADRRSGWWRS